MIDYKKIFDFLYADRLGSYYAQAVIFNLINKNGGK
jgi:hypothetical protein